MNYLYQDENGLYQVNEQALIEFEGDRYCGLSLYDAQLEALELNMEVSK